MSGPERVEAEAWIERAQNLPLEPLHAALSNRLAPAAERRALPRMLGKIPRLARDNPDLAPVYAAKIEAFSARAAVYNAVMARDLAIARIEQELNRMEVALAGRAWLAGTSYTLADVMWTPSLARIRLFGQGARLRQASRPNVTRYVDALQARPSYRTADVWDRISLGRALPLVLDTLFSRPRRVSPFRTA